MKIKIICLVFIFLFLLSGKNYVSGKMIFIDENIAWWCIEGKLINTVDGWKSQEIKKTSENRYMYVYDISFPECEKGWALGENFGMYRTFDGGNTWEPDETLKNRYITSFYFMDKNNGWILSLEDYVRTLLITDDGGVTWNEANIENYLQNADEITDLQFVDKNNGWLICKYEYDGLSGSFIYHTEDGGITWERQEKTFITLNSLCFLNENGGWAVGEQGTLLHTKDGGINWEKKNICEYGLFDVYFIDKDNGWAVGNNGVVYHTVNGSDWNSVDALPFRYTRAMSVYFKDLKTGWIENWSHGDYYITGTKDGGETWSDVTVLEYSDED